MSKPESQEQQVKYQQVEMNSNYTDHLQAQQQKFSQLIEEGLPLSSNIKVDTNNTKKILLYGSIVLVGAILGIALFGLIGKHKSELPHLTNPQNVDMFDLIKLKSTSALCLDGSHASYYVSRSGDSSKILVFLESGGWCAGHNEQETLQNCYSRSFTYLGSSDPYAQSIPSTDRNIFSTNPQNYFWDWKKIILNYCDGSGHQGTKKQPIVYKDRTLYFRGHNITVETFEELEKNFGLYSKATKVVISGISAGGLATFTWANYLQEKVQNGKVWAISDAGIFLDQQNWWNKKHQLKATLTNIMKISNAQIDPPSPECMLQFKDSKQNCMFAEHLYQHLRVPFFAVQPIYDGYTIPQVLGVRCFHYRNGMNSCNSQQRQSVEQNRRNITNFLDQIGKNPKNGVWGTSCFQHGILNQDGYLNPKITAPRLSEFTVDMAIRKWMENGDGDNVHIDRLDWSSDNKCW